MDPRTLGLSEEDLAKLGYEVRRGERPGRAGEAGPESLPPGTERPGSRSGRGAPGSGLGRWLWTTGLFLAAAWGASSTRQTMNPVPANRSDSVFSSGRAMAQLVEVARAPRPPGSPEHARVAEYLRARMDALGLQPADAGGTVARGSGPTFDVVTVRHLMGRIPGTASSGTILVATGYDTSPGSPGAGDDGLGMASLLEAARVLTASGPLRNDVVFLFADGTTFGEPGSDDLLTSHPWLQDVSASVRIDALGVSGPVWAIPSQTEDGSLASLVARVVPRPVMASVTEEVPPVSAPLGFQPEGALAGVPTVTLTAVGGYDVHGTALDQAERVSEGTLAHAGTQLVALVRYFGGLEAGAVVGRGEGRRVWMSLPALGVVGYGAGKAVPVGVGLVLLWLSLLASLRARKGRPRLVLATAGVGVAAVVLAAAAGFGVEELIRSTHAEVGRTPGGIWDAGPFTAAVAAAAVALTTGLVALARARLPAGEVHAGALLVPVAFTVWLSVAHPGAAPAAQLATGAALALAILLCWLPTRLLRTRTVWGFSVALGACVLFAAVPALEWTATVRGAEGLGATGALFGVATLTLVPVTEWLRAPRPWLTPLSGVIAVAALLGWGSHRASRPEDHPVPTTLALLVEDSISAAVVDTAADGSGVASEAPTPDSPVAPVRSVEGAWLTVRGAGEAWARSWAVPGRVPREPGDLLLPEGPEWIATGAGPAAPLGATTVVARSLRQEGGSGLVRLEVRPGLGGEMLALRVPEGSPVAVHAVDGVVLPSTDAVRRVRRWGRGDDPRVVFDLRVPDDGPFEVDVIEHHLRPRALLGGGFFGRNATVVPDASTGGDRVIQRVRVTVSGG